MSGLEVSGVGITLVCLHCRKALPVTVSRPPQFAFEVAGIAQGAGWLGVLDLAHGRALVFCAEECSAAEKKKKDGTYRLRPKGIQKEVSP